MRIMINNSNLELRFDEYSGELRELTCLKTGENILKNYIWERRMPFILTARCENGDILSLGVPSYEDIADEPLLQPWFVLNENGDGKKVLEITYNHLKNDLKRLNINVKISVSLRPEDYESIWSIEIKNDEYGCTIEDVWFPFVSGVYLDESWKDNTLIFPLWSAIKVKNPTNALSEKPAQIGWRWHDYNYTYTVGSVPAKKQEDGSYRLRTFHSGKASMNWMSCYGNDCGLYMASYNKSNITTVCAETFGNRRPGMGFCFAVHPYIKSGTVWTSDEYGIAFHPGDWHWGADRYREWRSCVEKEQKHTVPDWFKKSAGLIAHYDFKYQHRFMKPVHQYSHIEKLYHDAQELGINHLLISGWHKDGFDKGFPLYEYEPELGTENEFSNQVKNVVGQGGHVSFYINSRLFNKKYRDRLPALWENGLATNVRKEPYDDEYGSEEFYIMCPASEAWQNHILSTVKYLVEKIGADGVYLDQLNCGKPVLCFDSRHDHEHDDWNKGYDRMLDNINTYFCKENKNSLSIICEGASDIHGSRMSGQLISTFFFEMFGAFPEAYKYTFPEETLVEMIYPSRGRQIMRPVHVSRKAYRILDRAFLTGCYFWIYDLEEENTFKEDSEMREYLKDTVELRKLWLEKFGAGIYRDDEGIIDTTENTHAKLFMLADNSILLAVLNTDTERQCRLVIDTKGKRPDACSIYQLDGTTEKVTPGFHKSLSVIESCLKRLSLIHIKV